MSLDFDLVEMRPVSIFSRNITHNLAKMAVESGVYTCLWRPEDLGIEKAGDLIAPLQTGLALLRSDPSRFEKFNPENGWGSYEGLIQFVKSVLSACEKYPDATIEVSR